MSKPRVMTFVGIVSIAVIAAISLPLTLAKAETGCSTHGRTDVKQCVKKRCTDVKQCTKKYSKGCASMLEKVHAKHLPKISASIEKAIKAVEAGNKKTALAELHKAQKMLAAINAGIAKLVKPKFVNSKCPIMTTSPINPDKVAKNLVRQYKGQKVAFCCDGCPVKWDKLTNTAKDAKLLKAKPKPAEGHSSKHKMH